MPISGKKLKEQLREMVEIDQFLRAKAGTAGVENIDNLLVYVIDNIHNVRLHRILKSFPSLNVELIGEDGMHDLWLLIQHQDYDLDLQEQIINSCSFTSADKAYLTDRILVNQERKQRYGTQRYRSPEGSLVCYPLEDEALVNELRKQVDLGPLDENTG